MRDLQAHCAAHLHIYRIPCRRRGVRAYTGKVWAIAARDGTVLCYSITYPSTALIEDCLYAISMSV